MHPSPSGRDWARDFDVLDPEYINDPFRVWRDLRPVCPVARGSTRGGAWVPLRHEDLARIARDPRRFSSHGIAVVPSSWKPIERTILPFGIPPISADPPEHTWTRKLLQPWFSPARVQALEDVTRARCAELIDNFAVLGHADAASEYAQQIPGWLVAHLLGIQPEISVQFTAWVRDVLELAGDPGRRRQGMEALLTYLVAEINDRRGRTGDDLLTFLVNVEHDGERLPDSMVLGMCALVILAGVDTTWSAIGASLWHLATNPEDQERLSMSPALIVPAVEELLRAYAPVTMARLVTEEVTVAGRTLRPGDRILMSFPAANRDPALFECPDSIRLDRQDNQHVAFGIGIHRCLGATLARMELRVALEEWLRRIPRFRLRNEELIVWAGGQVRGPRSLPLTFDKTERWGSAS